MCALPIKLNKAYNCFYFVNMSVNRGAIQKQRRDSKNRHTDTFWTEFIDKFYIEESKFNCFIV